MTQRISPLWSAFGIALLITACTPTTPTDSGEGTSSSSAMMDSSSSSSYVQQLPMQDGEEQAESSMGINDEGIGKSSAAMEISSSSRAAAQSSAAASVAASSAPVVSAPRVISMTAESFKFTPSVINVKKGEKVTIRLTGVSGHHGFGVPGLGINTVVDEGKTVDVTLPTDTTGAFDFMCTIPCGSGHMDMHGTINIQ